MGLLGSVSNEHIKAEMNRMWDSTFKVLNKAYLAKRMYVCYVGLFMFMYGSQEGISLILFYPYSKFGFSSICNHFGYLKIWCFLDYI